MGANSREKFKTKTKPKNPHNTTAHKLIKNTFILRGEEGGREGLCEKAICLRPSIADLTFIVLIKSLFCQGSV